MALQQEASASLRPAVASPACCPKAHATFARRRRLRLHANERTGMVGAPFGGRGLYFNPPRLEKENRRRRGFDGRREDADLTVAGLSATCGLYWGYSAA